MIRRALAAALVVVGTACGVATLGTQTLAVGEVISSRLELPQDSPTVVWAFSDDDLLSCRSAAHVLRHAQRRYAGKVHFMALAVDTDEEVVEEFLRTERLSMPVSHVDQTGLRRRLVNVPTPFLYVVTSDTVVAVVQPPSRTVSDQNTAGDLDIALQHVLTDGSSRTGGIMSGITTD